MITKLKPNQIIVVGTNTLGHHYGGAAAQAYKDFGLEWGVEEGLSGNSYAFPTLNDDFKQQSRSQLEESRDILFNVCRENQDKEFILTKVGCGIAGFSEEDIKNLFKDHPNNLILPEGWDTYIPETCGDCDKCDNLMC